MAPIYYPSEAGLDTTELEQAPPQSLPAYQDATGTGANGPKYTTSEFWSNVARRTIPGEVGFNIKQARETGYNPLTPNAMTPLSDEDVAQGIPKDLQMWADKFVGVHSREEMAYRIQQLRQVNFDAHHGGQSPYAGVAGLAANLFDPVGMAAMTLPGAGEARLARAIHAASVGAGVAAVDETIMANIDPTWEFADAMKNVGASALLSGVLGGIVRGKVPSDEFDRMRSMLHEDLNAPTTEPAPIAGGDSAANIAQDMRRAAEAHGQNLASAAEVAAQEAKGLEPNAVAERLRVAQENMAALGELKPEALQAEMERLQAGSGVKERLAATYGDDLENVLKERATSNLEGPRTAARTELEAAQTDADRLKRMSDTAAAQAEFAKQAPKAEAIEGPKAKDLQMLEPTERAKLAEMYRQAAANKPAFDAKVSELAKGVGGEAQFAPLKSSKRAVAKVLGDYGGRAAPITDLMRATVQVRDAASLTRAAQGVRERFEVVAEKDRVTNPAPDGYRDMIFKVKMADGHIGEVQVNLPQMLEAKKANHAMYEESQALDRLKATRDLTDQELARLSELNAEQKAVYDQAWERASATNLSQAGLETETPLRSADELSNLRGGSVSNAQQERPLSSTATGSPISKSMNLVESSGRASGEGTFAATSTPPTPEMIARIRDIPTVGQRQLMLDATLADDVRKIAVEDTKTLPNEDWFGARPKGYTGEEISRAIDKAAAGEKLGPKQERLIQWYTDVANQRRATEAYMPNGDEAAGHDALEAGMVARLGQIDAEAVDHLARMFDEDHTGFMSHVKGLLDAHDESARLAESIPLDPEPLGVGAERRAPGRTDENAVPSGEPKAAAAAHEPGRALEQSAPDTSGLDLAELLKRLPPEDQARFKARIEALESPGEPQAMVAAPADSTAGAASRISKEHEMEQLSLARGGRVLGKALGWFAPGSRAMSSPSLAMRQTMSKLIETPETRNMNIPDQVNNPFGTASLITAEQNIKRWEGNWFEGHKAVDTAYRAYRARPQAEVEGPKMDRHTFNESVAMAMRRNDTWFVDEVQNAAKEQRRIVFNPLKREAQKLGLLPKDEDLTLGGTAESYLMRQYDRSKIQKDRAGWHKALVEGPGGFLQQGVERAEADELAHKVTANILGTELGLLDTNKSIFKSAPQSGRLKERTLKMPDLTLEPWLNNDIDTLSHSYLKSLAPQVEIMKAFNGDDLTHDGRSRDSWQERLAGDQSAHAGMQEGGPTVSQQRNLSGPAKDIVDEYAILKQRALADGNNELVNQLDKRLRSDLRDLAAVRDRLYGIYGAPSDSASYMQRAGRAIRSINALRLLGTATFSHIPDLANVIMKRGLTNTMATAAKLSTSLEALNLNRDQMHRIGAALDMIHNSTAAMLGEFGVESQYAFQKALNRATRAFTIATLETPWIATCKMLAGAAAHDEILDGAKRAKLFAQGKGADLSPRDRTRFNEMGLDQFVLQRIADQFDSHGQTVNGLRFGMSDKWEDLGAANAIDAATRSAAEASTLSPGAGDTPLWTSSEVGKAIFQFKTFGAVAIRRVIVPLAQGLAHMDARAASGLATLVAAGAATYTMKQLISGQPIEKKPDRYALEVLDKSNLLGWTGEYFYPALWQFGSGNFSRWGDRQTWETLGGPVAGTAVDAFDLRLPAKLIGQVKAGTGHYDPEDAHLTRSDIHRIRRMLPANQVWYLRRGVNNLEGYVGDRMGLPPQAPKGSSE